MYFRLALIFPVLFLISCVTMADGLEVKNSFELGEKSLSDILYEEEGDTIFTYRKYTSKIEKEDKDGIHWYLSTVFQERDYNTRNLDNDTNQINTRFSYPWKIEDGKTLKTGVSIKHRERYYEETTDENFIQNQASMDVTFKEEDDLKLGTSLGINSYEYISKPERNQDKLTAEIEGDYKVNQQISIYSSIREENNSQPEAERIQSKETYWLGFDLRPGWHLLSLLRGRIKSGEGDTKEDEEYDADLDYKFLDWYLRTEHELGKRLDLNFKYQNSRKDYTEDGTYDHHGFIATSGIRYQFINNTVRSVYFNISLEHKEMNYSVSPDLSTIKQGLYFGATYRKKGSWKVSPWVKTANQEYADPLNTQNTYEAGISCEKEFPFKDMSLGLELATRLKDFQHAPDETLTWLNLTHSIKF